MSSNHQPAPKALEVGLLERRAIVIALFLYPVFLLTLHGGMNAMFALLFLIALIHFVRARKYARDMLDFPGVGILSLAMASPLIAISLSQAFHADFQARSFDGASRLLLAIPILLVLRKVELKHLGIVQYAFPLGAIGAFFTVMLYAPNQQHPDSVNTYFLNHIHLGNLSLMLAVLSLLGIHWMRKDPPWAVLLKLLGCIAGIYVSVRTGTRGGWIALPIFFLVWFYFRNNTQPWRQISLALTLALVTCLAGYFLAQPVRSRIDLIYTDLLAFQHGDPDTSIGIRLQLWKAALFLFSENPLFGVGADGFKSAMQAMTSAGRITPMAAEFGGAEVHSEVLAHTVRFGIFGLISTMMVYFVPLFLFMKFAKTNLQPQRTAAIMGVVLVAGFLVFGLTVEILNLKMTIAFFGLTLAVLFAIATNKSKY
ncbi:MAG TPA: O-antigen ligase family protein [Sideroxyarcus sp.]|nr:O-antigen ligase family protein [Sideroxyarcus sp.]